MSTQPTTRELKIMFDNFEKRAAEKHGEVLDTLAKISSTGLATLSQAQRTNGRVTKLEDKLEDYDDIKHDVAGLINYKWWIIGIAAAFAVLGGTILYFISSEINTKINQGISQQFSNRFDKIELIK